MTEKELGGLRQSVNPESSYETSMWQIPFSFPRLRWPFLGKIQASIASIVKRKDLTLGHSSKRFHNSIELENDRCETDIGYKCFDYRLQVFCRR